jgi:hypothetical protein
MKNSANEGVQHTSGMYINRPPPGLALMEMNKAVYGPPEQHPAAVAPIATLQKNQNTGQASKGPAHGYTREDVKKMTNQLHAVAEKRKKKEMTPDNKRR